MGVTQATPNGAPKVDMLSSIIRLATRRGIALTAYRIHHAPIVIAHRSISLSRPHRASEESSFITGFKNSPLFAQLADKPEALQVLRDFAELLGKQGAVVQVIGCVMIWR